MGSDKTRATGNQSTHQNPPYELCDISLIERRLRGKRQLSIYMIAVEMGWLSRYLLPDNFSFAPAVYTGAQGQKLGECRNSTCAQTLFRRSPLLDEVRGAKAGIQLPWQGRARRGAPRYHCRISPNLLLFDPPLSSDRERHPRLWPRT